MLFILGSPSSGCDCANLSEPHTRTLFLELGSQVYTSPPNKWQKLQRLAAVDLVKATTRESLFCDFHTMGIVKTQRDNLNSVEHPVITYSFELAHPLCTNTLSQYCLQMRLNYANPQLISDHCWSQQPVQLLCLHLEAQSVFFISKNKHALAVRWLYP